MSEMTTKSRARLFAESTALDFVLVLAVSALLSFTVSYGFKSAPQYRGNLLMTCALQAPLLLAMYWGTWSKRTLPMSIGVSALVAVAVVGASIAMSPEPLFADGGYNDVPGNYATFAMVAEVCAALAFLLSRRRSGLVFLLAGAIVACGAVQFLWREWATEQPGIAATAVLLAGIAMLFVYRTYSQSVYTAKRTKRTSFFGAFGFSALVGAVCVLVGLGVFYGALNGLGLATPEIKPFEHCVAQPIDENAGTWQQIDDKDDDTTDDTDERKENTDQSARGQAGDGQSFAGLLDTPIGQAVQAVTGYDVDDPEQDVQEVAYLILQVTVIVTVLAILLALLAAILLQRARRNWRLRKMEREGRSYAYRIWYLYGFLLGRLKRLKITKPDHLTPYEFATGFEGALAPFTRETGGVSFLDVTRVYMDALWGGAGEHENASGYEEVETFYKAFFKNARSYVGWPKWLLWKFWRI